MVRRKLLQFWSVLSILKSVSNTVILFVTSIGLFYVSTRGRQFAQNKDYNPFSATLLS